MSSVLRLLLLLCLLLITAKLGQLSVSAAKAHEWYGEECCSGVDCQPAPLGSVVPFNPPLASKKKPGFIVKGWVKNPSGIELGSDIYVPFDSPTIRPRPAGAPPGIDICTGSGLVRCIYKKAGG